MSGDFKIENKIISFEDIKKTYEVDSQSTSARAMCKITPIHLIPNAFQKMSCKLAIQLFSKSVSAAIKTCVSTNELQSSSALYTSEFVDIMNDMFDTCNSKNLYDPNPNRKPICDRNPGTIENLERARSIFQKSIKISNKNKKISIPPCFTGIIWTTTALIELFHSEKNDSKCFQPEKEYFLLTNRLTQDALENLFSIMRQKNGYVYCIYVYNISFIIISQIIYIIFVLHKIIKILLKILYIYIYINLIITYINLIFF
jgi:hypothetical protein